MGGVAVGQGRMGVGNQMRDVSVHVWEELGYVCICIYLTGKTAFTSMGRPPKI